jgi:hypothetical protein
MTLQLEKNNSRHLLQPSTARIKDMEQLQWEECSPGAVFRAAAEVPYDRLPDDPDVRFALFALNVAASHEETADGAMEFVTLHNQIVRSIDLASPCPSQPIAVLTDLRRNQTALLSMALDIVLEHTEFADDLLPVTRIKRKYLQNLQVADVVSNPCEIAEEHDDQKVQLRHVLVWLVDTVGKRRFM